MTSTNPSRSFLSLGLGVGLGAAATAMLLYPKTQSAETYARQLHGQLSDKERELEAMNTSLGTAQSRLVSQNSLEEQYKAQLSDKDAAFEKFRQAHDLRIKSMSENLEALRQQVHQGRGHATELAAASPPGSPAAPSSRPVIAYEYSDSQGRFHLSDPNIWVEGDETLDVNQLFLLKGEVFAQKNGSLMTERLQLSEVVKARDGSYTEVAHATLADAHFQYTNPPLPPEPNRDGLGLSVLLTVGPSFSSQTSVPWVRFGGAVNVLRLGSFGLAGGLSSDFRPQRPLDGTGGEVLVTWQPHPRLNVMLGAGVHLPLTDPTRVQPALNAGFILY